MYPNAESAQQGRLAGGSGFFIDYLAPSAKWFRYIVTNIHVVRHGCTTMRVNTKDGGTAVFDIPADDWIDHPDGDDIAVARVDIDSHPDWDVKGLDWSAFVGSVDSFRNRMVELNVGVGDEVIMLGRFVWHAGIQTQSASCPLRKHSADAG